MALANKIDEHEAQRSLEEWLDGRLRDATDVQVSGVEVPSESGLSNETVMFEAAWTADGETVRQRMVARVQPDGPGVFPMYDLLTEARVMKALAEGSEVQAPAALFHEDDPSVLGAPFIVMERAEGKVPSDDPPFTATGWVLELSDAQRSALADNALGELAAIHRADWRGLGLDFLQEPVHAPGLDGQLAEAREWFEWAATGEPNPTVEAGLEWLDANRPANLGPLVLNWGDARVGNMLFAPDQSVTAVLDWEMVALAPAEVDLGWWQFLLRHHTEGIGAPMPGGFPSFEGQMARYEELAGRAVGDLHYYEVLAGVRLSTLMVRAAHMMIAGGMLPQDSEMALNNPASQLVAKLLGLPAPTGAATSFIGNR